MKHTLKAISPMSPTPQNPSYGGGGGGGSISPQSPNYGAAPQGYSNTMGSNAGWTYSIGGATATMQPAINPAGSMIKAEEPLAKLSYLNDNINLELNSEEGQPIKLTYEPDASLTAIDFSKIMLLLVFIENGGINYRADIAHYIRANGLEKHFRFTV